MVVEKVDWRLGRLRIPIGLCGVLLLAVVVVLLGSGGRAVAAEVVCSANFEAAFAGWTFSGHPDWHTGTPKNGTHSIQLRQTEAIQRTIATTGYSHITVSFSLAAYGLDNATEIVRASWNDGAHWVVLKEIRGGSAENDGQLRSYSYSLPSSANNNPRFALRFEIIASSHGNDFGYVDDVAVTGDAPHRTLSLAGSGSGSVRVNGSLQSLPWSGEFANGAAVTLEAVPQSGWQFGSWSGDVGGSSNPIVVTMDGDKNVTASFSQLQYTLSLSKVGSGTVKVNGTTRSLPWSGQFLSGTEVSLEAVADSGWEFGSWSGDASGLGNPIAVAIDGDKSVTASFSQLQYTLSLSKVGSGSLAVNGTTRSLPWSGQFLSGAVVTLEAAPGSGWEFGSWSGDVSGSSNPVAVAMDGDKTVTANFSQLQYTLSLSKVGSGTVKVNGTTRSLPWSGQFLSGTEVSLEAVADSGWEFGSWSGDASGLGNPIAVAIDGDKSVTASFSQLRYTLTLAKIGSGTVQVNGAALSLPWSGEFLSGTEVTLEAVAELGWEFESWSGDVSGSSNPITVTMDGDTTITASFDELRYTLSLSKVGSGTVKVNGSARALPWSGEFTYGTRVFLEAVPDDGWRFERWSGDVNWPGTLLFVTMTGSKTITATFNDASYTLSLSGVGSGSVKVNGRLHSLPWSGRFLRESQVDLEAVPDEGWRFDRWSGDLNWPGSTLIVIMTGDRNVAANFVERSSFVLSLSRTGSGSMSVDGLPVSLPWSGTVPRGGTVTLQASPSTGWVFEGWSGDLAGAGNPTVLTMTRDWAVTADFGEVHYELSLSGNGSGSVKVNGEQHSLPWSDDFRANSSITLEPAPDSGWDFGGWCGDLTGVDSPVSFSLTNNMAICVTFVRPDSFTLTVNKTGSGSVKVNGMVQSLPWSSAIPNGAEVTLEALAEGEEQFVQWSGDVSSTSNPVTVVMDANKTVTAEFLCLAGPFADIACDHWAAGGIAAAKAAGIIAGYPDGLYRPAWPVDRGSMAVYIARALCGGDDQIPDPPAEPTFSDVPASHWAYAAVEYATSHSIVEGYGDGTYRPDWDVTRGHMAVFIARSLVRPLGEEGLADYEPPADPSFDDVPPTLWCYKHVEYIAGLGVTAGYPDRLYRPSATVTRDQMAVYVARAFDLVDSRITE